MIFPFYDIPFGLVEVWKVDIPLEMAFDVGEIHSVGQGMGLGLSLSHDIVVQGHGGTLTVENAEDGCTTFVITLPV